MRKICLSLLLGGCAALTSHLATAKTVALWPLEYDARLGENNLRCMVNPANDMTLGKAVVSVTNNAALPWALPPNPDTARHVYACDNARAFWNLDASGNQSQICYAKSEAIARALCVTNDFTLEGWINIQDVPGTNKWYILAMAHGAFENTGGWTLSLRQQKESDYKLDFVLYVCTEKGKGADIHLGRNEQKWFMPEDYDGLTNRWMHLALVHRARNAKNKEEWTVFTNGVAFVTELRDPFPTTETYNGGALDLGGRSTVGQRFKGGLDYWRISDEALEPSAFLCAGGAGTPAAVDTSPSLHYWKLDRTKDGGIDCSAQLGRVPLSLEFPSPVDGSSGYFLPSRDVAFEGQPPNSAVTLQDGGNRGSFSAANGNCAWEFNNLGQKVDIDRSFTLEGWFKPQRGLADQRVQRIFETRTGLNGWAFHLHTGTDRRWHLKLFVQQTNGVVLASDHLLSGDLSHWSDWKHVALVYDHTAADGRGVWTAYLDGEMCGCHTNTATPTMATGSQVFRIGGQPKSNRSFSGGIDCLRVTARALAPEELLCATTNPRLVAAADILAFWPLDCSADGLACIGTDLMGNYSFAPELPDCIRPSSVADAPAISNPDATWTFCGDTNLSGSVLFSSATSRCAYLRTEDPGVVEMFRGTSGWTAECYVKRTETVLEWEVLLAAFSRSLLNEFGAAFALSYRTSGFVLYDNVTTDRPHLIEDQKFPNSTSDDLPIGVWKHVALVCDYRIIDEVRKVVHEVYVDGVSVGALTNTPLETPTTHGKMFSVGGRAHSENSFKGCISSVRLSSRPLAPSEFLCAPEPMPSDPPEAVTSAMWPLDWTAGALDLESRVTAGARFRNVEDVAGSTETARGRVPNADPSEDYEGDSKRNVGSVTFGSTGSLSLNSLGTRTETTVPFTVEGWVKWAHADAPHGHEVIVGTYLASKLAGWKLYVDTTGATPALRLFAQPYFPCSPLVGDATLVADVSSWEDTWKHVALVYDPKVGRGTWSCYVDGKLAGSAENIWAPQGATFGVHAFALGRFASDTTVDAFAGGYDMWRLAQGALTPEEFLYRRASGTLLLLR